MNAVLPILTLFIGGALGYWIAVKFIAVQRAGNGADAQLAEAQLVDAHEKLVVLEREIRAYTIEVATLSTEKRASDEKLREQQTYMEKAQGQLQLQFKNLAHEIFEEKNTQSKKSLQELLNPFKEELGGFKKHINESFGKQANEQFALQREIANIVKVSSEMKFQTESLSKALKGDVKTQGTWGEMILERILESSGLRKGVHYVTQGTGMNLKHPEDGRTQKPDVVIKMPEDKHAIVDSKVSLTHYERFCAEEEEPHKAQHLQQFLQSVKNHVKGLESRRYQDTEGLNTPEYVLMFVPIEGAYALAMQLDADLHAHAWDRKIIIVCPNTLFAILKMMDSMWKLDDQNRNVADIVKRGGLLYDKFAGFLEDMETVGMALSKAQNAYDGACNKLSQGSGNILNQAKDLVKLGAKTSKKIPKKFAGQGEAEETIERLSLAKDDAA